MSSMEYVWQNSVAENQVPQLCRLFADQWWTSDRTQADIRRMLAGSDVVVAVLRQGGPLVGFARALTDGVYLAVVLDVIVDPRERGQGLGQRLVERLLGDPRLTEVRSVELVCQPALRTFYRRFGFTEEVGSSGLMRRTSDSRLLGQTPAP